MTGLELQRRRVAVGMSVDQLAELLNRHRDEVEAWERIEGDLARTTSRELDWVLALEEHNKAFVDAGILPCPWVAEHEKAVDFKSTKAVTAYLESLDTHARECEHCERRRVFAETLPPLPEMPLPPYVRLFGKLKEKIDHLPSWLQPAAWGAVGIGVLTVVRGVAMVGLRRVAITPKLFLGLLGAVLVGAYMGAVGGLTYSVAKKPAARLGRFRPYGLGVACAYAYLLAFGVPDAIIDRGSMLRSLSGWAIFVLIGTFFGLVVGQSLFKEGGA
jgi:hypothetical protein